MKIVDQARLGFREGNSDKVYEVDLVEVATAQYVVNFRYGRRGTALRDGTKTPLPISLERARSLFTALVAEKTNRGYQPISGAPSTGPQPGARSGVDPAERAARTAQALITALERGHRGQTPLYLAVRKVGDRGLQQAEPALLELLASGAAEKSWKPEVLQHFLIGALARCGSARSLTPLRAIAADAKAPRHLRDVARLAIVAIAGDEERRQARQNLPLELQPGSEAELPVRIRALERLLVDRPSAAHAAIFGLYLSALPNTLDSSSEAEQLARRLVLSVARLARLEGAELGLLRTLNWSAELRRDSELFALLTRRFESSAAAKRSTMDYFRRRAARTLRRLGSIGSEDYVKFASELVTSYRDADAEETQATDSVTWDAFGRYHALNFVLYGNSARYERAGHRRATWRCRPGYTPGGLAGAAREESYPALWDLAPDALWQIAVSPAAGVAIHFAVRALRDQSAFLARVPDPTLAEALRGAQPPMRSLAFDVARLRAPNLVLASAALSSGLDEANAWVLSWIERTPGLLRADPELLALLITAMSAAVREATLRLTRELTIAGDAGRHLVLLVVAHLMQLPDEPGQSERARDAGAFLLQRAAAAVDGLGLDVMRDLLGHALSGAAEFGAELVLRRARKGALEDGLLDALLSSPHVAVRSIGARIVADTPPALFEHEPGLLAHFALSENAELRSGTRALLLEVARQYPDAAREVASQLLDALLTRTAEGVPAHVVAVLRHELRACLPKRDVSSVMALVGARSPHAREAGGLLVALLDPDELELELVVRLANHEILLIRQGAWALASAAKQRFRLAPIALSRLCDARWEDSRAFAFDFVRSFSPADLVPDGVVAICDSIEPAVQRFGQTLLLEYWRDEHAERYLLHLSEHPSTNIQLLVSGLLERYARGNLTLLERLLPCLITVLSQVNRAGVAKQRVLDFLRTEAVASAQAAALLAPLLDRQSLTRAVSHKGALIATMVDLHERYPGVPVPISSPPVPLRTRGSRGL
ncbi:MAG TPA: WGR domain-containing protein [Polyangiaceae bacterium]|nr:WGR domain-containing protein [Polyangiaceae bacterium]